MNNTMKNLGIIIAALLVVASVYLVGVNRGPVPKVLVGSINGYDSYIASSSDSTVAGRSQKYKGAVVGSTPIGGIFGSYIITGTSATVIEIKDATSTTDLASTSIATFAASTAAGTYTFDTGFSRGLIINYLGAFAGQGSITYK